MKLQYPVTVDGKTYDNLDMRRMTGADMVAMEKLQKQGLTEAEVSLSVIALLCNVPEEVPLALDVEDILALTEAMEGFLPNGAKPKGNTPVP